VILQVAVRMPCPVVDDVSPDSPPAFLVGGLGGTVDFLLSPSKDAPDVPDVVLLEVDASLALHLRKGLVSSFFTGDELLCGACLMLLFSLLTVVVLVGVVLPSRDAGERT